MSELDKIAGLLRTSLEPLGCPSGVYKVCAKRMMAAGFQFVGPDQVVVPIEPTNAMILAGLERGLAWMKENDVDGLSPWQDYPKVSDTMRVIVRAILLSASQEKP